MGTRPYNGMIPNRQAIITLTRASYRESTVNSVLGRSPDL